MLTVQMPTNATFDQSHHHPATLEDLINNIPALFCTAHEPYNVKPHIIRFDMSQHTLDSPQIIGCVHILFFCCTIVHTLLFVMQNM